MEKLLRENRLGGVFADVLAFWHDRALLKHRPAEPIELVWWMLMASVTLSTLPRFMGDVSAPLTYIIAFGGAAGCGWIWLLARSLFRPAGAITRWTLIAVGAVIIVEGGASLGILSAIDPASSDLQRVIGNAASLICMGAIALVFVEALSRHQQQLSAAEKRFRTIFVAGFSTIIILALVLAGGATETSFGAGWLESVETACGIAAVLGSRIAVSYRKRHPLGLTKSQKDTKAQVNDPALAGRILAALEHDQLFTTADLKVADMAATLGVHEYKVSQCITGPLGYRNFNHLINERRIDYAKQALHDPKNRHCPILSIAFECGFNSVGPFNRAFKKQVGMTPSSYRNL